LFDWRQSEHVALIGPNGQGKTTLLISILPKRTYVAVLVTKPRDETIDKLIASGYDEYREWLDVDPDKSPRRVIWPDANLIRLSAFQEREPFDPRDAQAAQCRLDARPRRLGDPRALDAHRLARRVGLQVAEKHPFY